MNHLEDVKARLEYLRGEVRGERISMGELVELQTLASYIDDGDVELLEAAGVEEYPEPFLTIEEIKKANADKGGYWFSEGALAFFNSVVYPTVYGGQWFISSECPPMGTRAYSIRVVHRNGDIGTVGDFMGYDTLEDAIEGALALERGEAPTSKKWPREPKVEVYEISLSLDANETNIAAVLASLGALLDYALELGGYEELASIEIER